MTAIPTSNPMSADHPRYLGPLAARLFTLAAGTGAGLIILSVILAFATGVSKDRFFKSWLVAFMFVLAISLGGLFFTVVQHMTRAGWSVSVRRIAEAFASNLTWIWILFLPILVAALMGGGKVLYPWMDPAKLDPANVEKFDFLYAHKSPWLNAGFWAVRAVVYLGIWAFLGWFFFNRSVRQDHDGDKAHTHAMQRLAPLAIIAFALTLTFAAVDWVMAIEAHWFSTMWGVYFFAISACGFFSALPITMYLLQRSGRIENDVTKEHFQDMGKLLFGFGVVFHAYIGFSQFMLIWYANIPEVTGWYITRTSGPWLPLMYLLPIGHFAIPFVLLVTKHTKRIPAVLALIAGWILVMQFVDLYLLVHPKVPYAIETAESLNEIRELASTDPLKVGFSPHLIDITLLLGLIALFVAGTAWRLRGVSLVPSRDPRLSEALNFENM
ncbi:MAG: quinol:cytochrome C oxidoreductase [Phycisphaerales bacterium]